MTSDALRDMAQRIEKAGYYPAFSRDAVTVALADEELLASLVHHESSFAGEELHRHLTVLALTSTRLVVVHVNEDDARDVPVAVATCESVALPDITAVTLSRLAPNPETYDGDGPSVTEAWLTIYWGVLARLSLEAGHCGDPTCQADHGMVGTSVGEDLVIRVSSAVEGVEDRRSLEAFAARLQVQVATSKCR